MPHRSETMPRRKVGITHRSKATPSRKIGLIRNRTDRDSNYTKRKDRSKRKARAFATLQPAVALVCAEDGGDHAAPEDVWMSEAPDGGTLAHYPALHMHGLYAEDVAKLNEERQEDPGELNRWDVALEIFTLEEAYRLRRLVDKVMPPVNERRETLGLSVHDDDKGGGDVLDGTALPADPNAVALLGHGDGGVLCVGNDLVMDVNSDVRVPGNGRESVLLQDNGFLQPCNTISMHPDAGMDGYRQQHMVAMDMYGYDYDRIAIATINQQLACDVCQQSTTQQYGFEGICNSGGKSTDGNFAGAPLALPLAMSSGDDLMNACRSLQRNDTYCQLYLCYPEDMDLQDRNSGGNNLPSVQSVEPLPPAIFQERRTLRYTLSELVQLIPNLRGFDIPTLEMGRLGINRTSLHEVSLRNAKRTSRN